MRHTFHRPLWSAFHFYLYLPPRELPSPTSRDFIYTVVLRVNGAQGAETTGKAIEDGEETRAGWEKDGRIVAETFPPDILRHFVSNPKVEGVGASPGIGLIRLLWR